MAPITVETYQNVKENKTNSESKGSQPDMLSPSVVTGGGVGEAIPEVVWPPSGGVVINPRRACAARVTVVVLAGACLSVSLLPRFLSLHSPKRPSSDTNGFRVTLA